MTYNWPAKYVNSDDNYLIYDKLKEWRSEASQNREYFLSKIKNFKFPLQKEEDRKIFKYLKEISNYWLKIERACSFAIPWFGESKQQAIPFEEWPLDLKNELDEIGNRILLL